MRTQHPTTRIVLVSSAAALVVLAAGLFMLRQHGPLPDALERSAAVQQATQPAPALRFSFHWQQEQQLHSSLLDSQATVDLEGEAQLELDTSASPAQLRIAITHLDRNLYKIDDTQLELRDLLQHTQVFALDAAGGLESLPVSATTASVERRVIHNLLSGGLVEALTVAAGTRGEVRRLSSLGEVLETCQHDGAQRRCQAQRLTSTRGLADTTAEQIALVGDRRSETNALGLLERFRSDYSARTQADAPLTMHWHDSQDWQLLETGATTPLALASPGAQQGDSTQARSDLDHKLDLGQANGLTAARVLSGLQVFAADDQARPEGRWIWQSAAVLRLQPELAGSLGELAARSDTQPKARALIVDLLSQVGHEQAQQALRGALDSEAVQRDPDVALLVQRLAFVPEPDAATVAYAQSLRSRDDGDRRNGATRALGAMAGHLGSQTDPAQVARGQHIVDDLQGELGQTADSAQRAQLIAALGNAGALASLPTLLAHSHDDDAQVRRAAASALRGHLETSSRQRLLQLIADPAIMVQRAALRALQHHSLDDGEQRSVATMVRERRVDPVNYPMLVNTAERVTSGEARRDLLQTVLRAANDDPKLRGRIRGMLRAN